MVAGDGCNPLCSLFVRPMLSGNGDVDSSSVDTGWQGLDERHGW